MSWKYWCSVCYDGLGQTDKDYDAVVGHKRQGLSVGCKQITVAPQNEQFIVEGRHEGIVTKEEFLKAQKNC